MYNQSGKHVHTTMHILKCVKNAKVCEVQTGDCL